MPAAPGFVIFGTPPIASADQMSEAFLPNPAMATTFNPSVSDEEARAYAEAFTAPRSALDLGEIVADVLRTDGAARAGLGASLAEGRYADEIAIASALGQAAGHPARRGRAAHQPRLPAHAEHPRPCGGARSSSSPRRPRPPPGNPGPVHRPARPVPRRDVTSQSRSQGGSSPILA